MADGLALFESWRGRYADAPRALSESMPATVGLRRTWVGSGSDETVFPSDVRVVRRHSAAYFADLLRARLLVANDIISQHHVKGPRVRYVQTWHGTPLKRIGLDEGQSVYAGAAAHRRRVRRDVAKWDYLLSPSPACTELFRQAFGYRGTVLETGNPANDVLRSAAAGALRARTRERLGLADGTTAVLYAPTWRDDQNLPGGGFGQDPGIDAPLLQRLLPEDTRLLTRMHRNVSRRPEYDAPGFAVDVSGHDQIAELYLAADVLVSDYSSAVYDFAVTGKPIVLLAPDLDHYEQSVRGFYFDYASWAPGPVVETTRELAAVLSDLPGSVAPYPDFVARFCPLDDGHASARVWDALQD